MTQAARSARKEKTRVLPILPVSLVMTSSFTSIQEATRGYKLTNTSLSLRPSTCRHSSPSSMPDICHMNLASSVVALAPTSLLWFSGRASGLAAWRSLPNFIPSWGLALPDFPELFNKSSFKVADSQSKNSKVNRSFWKKYWSLFPRRICLNLARKGCSISAMPWS